MKYAALTMRVTNK